MKRVRGNRLFKAIAEKGAIGSAMSSRKMGGNKNSSLNNVEGSVVVVAVEASHEISRTALTWALSNVVQPGDCIRLLVVIPPHSSGNKKLWGGLPKLHIPRLHSDCTTGYWNSMSGTLLDQREYITELCNQMMKEIWEIYDPEKVSLKMKVIYGATDGVVASEAKKVQTQWVVLDKRMKREARSCMEQLDCNVVIVKNSEPKVLRLNLIEPNMTQTEVLSSSISSTECIQNDFVIQWNTTRVPNVTPTSSPDHSPLLNPDRTSSMSIIDMFTSPKFVSEINWEPKVRQILPFSLQNYEFDESDSQSDSDNLSSLSTSRSSHQWMDDNLSSADEGSKRSKWGLQRSRSKTSSSISEHDRNPDPSRNVREMISLNKNAPSDSPPLCSVCRHKAPLFGKPPKSFSYFELEQATSGFSEANFLAEGGYGSVHKGVLSDGRVVAVKQHKAASCQGDREFCSEVQVLSCAQHCNVVMLIGYCVEDGRRLLVYEYICNGSLDYHLYGHGRCPLDWAARQKIAVGAARGLSYLHEECRVGCIVHRDMRPNNILLTHDFEPLVGDFGLARLQGDGGLREETRVIGTFGYLAPEYAQTGLVNEKADVYSFGVVLVELITGKKAVDINRPKGEQCLTLWARPLLEENAVSKLVDPCLMKCYSEKEVQAMLHCASLCLNRDPELRPRMSQVHRMLEGDILMR